MIVSEVPYEQKMNGKGIFRKQMNLQTTDVVILATKECITVTWEAEGEVAECSITLLLSEA